MVRIRTHRPRSRSRHGAPSRPPYLVLILVAFVVIASVVSATSHGGAARGRSLATVAAASVTGLAQPAKAATPTPDPTPCFARYGSLKLHLPVAAASVTALAFHQASYTDALHLVSLVPDADMTLAARLKAVPPLKNGAHELDGGGGDVWRGQALRLWRSNRYGKPDTAVDCGADAGTVVLAPVSGTVVLIKPYLLYGKYPDYEIHIRPTGCPDIEAVLIHVTDLSIAKGDAVVGGVTPIAHVRRFSNRMSLQLGEYTKNGGDHVHVQLNRAGAKGASGSDS